MGTIQIWPRHCYDLSESSSVAKPFLRRCQLRLLARYLLMYAPHSVYSVYYSRTYHRTYYYRTSRPTETESANPNHPRRGGPTILPADTEINLNCCSRSKHITRNTRQEFKYLVPVCHFSRSMKLYVVRMPSIISNQLFP